MTKTTRRLALLGTAGLLAGCESLQDGFDSIFGESKRPLPGTRRSVLSSTQGLTVDEGTRPQVRLPAPEARADWPQPGGGSTHFAGHPALGRPLAEAWRSSIGTGAAYRRRLTAPPIVADGVVYAMDAYGYVTALDAATGRRRWRIDTRPDKDRDGALGGGLAFAGGTLFAATGLAEAMAITPADGKIRWRVRIPAPARGAPVVADGRLFVPTIDNQLAAIKTEEGERLWLYRTQAVSALSLGLPAPAVEGDTVVAGFANGELAAVRISDGRMSWSEALGGARGNSVADITAVSGMPVIERGTVYASAQGGITIALDIRSGRRLWEREVASAETPWVAGDALFLMSQGADLLCMGREDGRIRWLQTLPRFQDEQRSRDPITWSGPTLAGGRLLLTNSLAQLLEVDPTSGNPLARIKLPDPVLLPPAIAGGTLYLLTEDADVVAIRGS